MSKGKRLVEPFLLQPAGKEYLWGGRRLRDDFGKQFASDMLAETWECSTHPEGSSIVASGELAGSSLREVVRKNPEILGTHPDVKDGLPILIKFIDAKQDLSVQVHPNDEYAKQNECGALGKTEMWYVVDASKDAKLVYGFQHDMEQEVLRASIESGSVEKYLQKIPVQKDDVFYIPAGQVHAIGAGSLIAEIQECSNITYRLYDYDRIDKQGRKRELHVDKALAVANLQGSREPRQPMRILRFKEGQASELLCRCKYFQVERLLVNTERCRNLAHFEVGNTSFQVLLCLQGCGVLCWRDKMLNFFKGDCVFLPAACGEVRIHGKAQFLKVGC